MGRCLIFVLSVIVLAGCGGQDDLRSYQYNGVFLCPKDAEFYNLEADFYPSDNGCDLLIVTQKDEDGEIMQTSGFIVKYEKGDLELIGGAMGSPVFSIKMENGGKDTHNVSSIEARKESILLYGGLFQLDLRRGNKNILDPYKK